MGRRVAAAAGEGWACHFITYQSCSNQNPMQGHVSTALRKDNARSKERSTYTRSLCINIGVFHRERCPELARENIDVKRLSNGL